MEGITFTVVRKGFCKGFLKMGGVSFLFYKSILISFFIGTFAGVFGIFREKKRKRRMEQEEIMLQFREGLQGIASSLCAGYSIENAFTESRRDLELLYGKDSLLAKEFLWIEQQIAMNQSVEKVLFQFAKRWNTEDILSFAQVFQTAKRTGGDLIAITRSTAEKTSMKIEVRREIQTMISGKKMESRIMNGIPLGIILYFWLCSPGFLDCMYQLSGRVFMTILFVIYLLAYRWSESISDIVV